MADTLEIYIIETSKVKSYSKGKKLDTWVNFIIKSVDIDMSNSDESLKKAKKVLEKISEMNMKDIYQTYIKNTY